MTEVQKLEYLLKLFKKDQCNVRLNYKILRKISQILRKKICCDNNIFSYFQKQICDLNYKINNSFAHFTQYIQTENKCDAPECSKPIVLTIENIGMVSAFITIKDDNIIIQNNIADSVIMLQGTQGLIELPYIQTAEYNVNGNINIYNTDTNKMYNGIVYSSEGFVYYAISSNVEVPINENFTGKLQISINLFKKH